MKAVEARDIVKTFGEIKALDGVSVSFDPGIIYGFLGPNGAGKTTLIRVLTTLLKPDSGSARVVGIDAIENPVAVRDKIGLAGQFAAVDDFLTGRENVEMVGRLYNLTKRDAERRAGEVLERIHLSDAADRPVRTYSGGMRRRLDLAASIVGRPEVLFLDEPTTGVDPGSRLDLWDLIAELVEGGTTLLLTTQYLEEADRLADRIGVIDHGRLIDEGTSDELKDRLGGNVVEVHVADDDRATAAGALTGIADGELRVEGNSLLIPAHEGPRTLTSAVRALDDIGVEPRDIGLRRPTLDDVFLALTGHHAEEAPRESAGAGSSRGWARRSR
ncbi:MAG TPA: ATP-binding cassette domain-containing protein [Acidimicrobiia bacterium]|nr:ATP-binding cassette domain-containing protein [Acidimicrobiia bacterium]